MQLRFVITTLPDKIVTSARACMEEPVVIIDDHVQAANRNIEQGLVFVRTENGMIPVLRAMVRVGKLDPHTIVFVE